MLTLLPPAINILLWLGLLELLTSGVVGNVFFYIQGVIAWCQRYHDNNQRASENLAKVLFEVLGLDSKSMGKWP